MKFVPITVIRSLMHAAPGWKSKIPGRPLYSSPLALFSDVGAAERVGTAVLLTALTACVTCFEA
jgi:hypothetical protein